MTVGANKAEVRGRVIPRLLVQILRNEYKRTTVVRVGYTASMTLVLIGADFSAFNLFGRVGTQVFSADVVMPRKRVECFVGREGLRSLQRNQGLSDAFRFTHNLLEIFQVVSPRERPCKDLLHCREFIVPHVECTEITGNIFISLCQLC